METWDGLLHGITLATAGGDGYGLVPEAALGWRDGRVAFAAAASALPAAPERCARDVRRLDGELVTPGLVDCHTHAVFGGERANEFEQRLEGATYEQIARAGGGIAATVRATRAASEDELLAAALPRARDLVRSGATTIGGKVPVNASGGLACFGEAIPAQAIAQVCELTWQLKGQATGRQVEGATVGVTANQGLFGHGSSVIVAR